jgi:hypothetical protein
LAIHRDFALGDELFGFPSGAESCVGDDLLDSLGCHVVLWFLSAVFIPVLFSVQGLFSIEKVTGFFYKPI